MGEHVDTLETELLRDLSAFEQRFGDDEFCAELYRALTDRTLSKDGGPDGHLVLSWSRAEDFVNTLRERYDGGPLPLAQSGGEGVVSETVSEVLEQHGWSGRPLSTGNREGSQP